jgi:stress-induced morphogen
MDENSSSFKEEKEGSPSFKDEGLEGSVEVPPRVGEEDAHEMKDGGQEDDDDGQEDEEVEDEDETKVPPLHLDTNVSPLHNRLHQALHCDLLHPIHVEVKNLSYWYAMRAKMGPKKHAAIVLRQNKNNFRWESYIFKMKPREEDLEIVPVRSLVGAYKSKMVAYKHGEKACRERDSNPALQENSHLKPEQISSTHFHLTVVSTCFDRLSVQERQELVYEALLQGAGTPLTATTPTRSKYPKELPHPDLDLTEPLSKEGVKGLKDRNYYNYNRTSFLGCSWMPLPSTRISGNGMCRRSQI